MKFDAFVKFGGWVIAVVIGTVGVINYVQSPVDELDGRVNGLGERISVVEGEHVYFSEELDKTISGFTKALEKQSEAILTLQRSVVRLETLVGVNISSLKNNQ